MRNCRTILWATLFTCAFHSQLTQADDQVEYRVDGKRSTARGTIKEETFKEVVIQTATGETKIPANQVEVVRYDKQPADLVSAQSKFNSGRFDDAIDEYKRIFPQARENERLQAFIAFMVFRATAAQAGTDSTKTAEALALYKRFTETFTESRHLLAASDIAARLYVETGDYAKLDDVIKIFDKVTFAGYKEKSMLLRGLALLGQKKEKEALDLFQQVAKNDNEDRTTVEQKCLALAYQGEVLARQQKFDDAVKHLTKSLEQFPADALEARAIACNALGDSLHGLKKHKDAAFDGYLKVVLLYNKNPEQSARAIYSLTQVFAAIDMKDQVKKFSTMLRETYPNSSWAKKLPAES